MRLISFLNTHLTSSLFIAFLKILFSLGCLRLWWDMFSELITRKKEEKNKKAQNYYIKTKVELKEKRNRCIDFTCLTNFNYDTMT